MGVLVGGESNTPVAESIEAGRPSAPFDKVDL
jgi:hypothetical protein